MNGAEWRKRGDWGDIMEWWYEGTDWQRPKVERVRDKNEIILAARWKVLRKW